MLVSVFFIYFFVGICSSSSSSFSFFYFVPLTFNNTFQWRCVQITKINFAIYVLRRSVRCGGTETDFAENRGESFACENHLSLRDFGK